MRAERMISILLLMQSKGRVTAREVADELEVSVATARRDLEALSVAGVPVYPQPGRGGGWSLVGGARTDLTGLTADEAQALFSLLGPAADSSPQVSSAVRKLMRALPGPFRDDAASAAAAIHVDGLGWGDEAKARPPGLDDVRQAIVDRVWIRFHYTGRSGRAVVRRASPLGLIDKSGSWYLIALSAGDSRPRTYRMDRVRLLEVTAEPAEWPAGFDLDQEWQRVVGYIEEQRSLVQATLRIPKRHLWVLRDHFGTYLTRGADLDDGLVEVTVAAHTARSIAEQLAGWGATVEVLTPGEVRDHLADIGTELVGRYARR